VETTELEENDAYVTGYYFVLFSIKKSIAKILISLCHNRYRDYCAEKRIKNKSKRSFQKSGFTEVCGTFTGHLTITGQ